jgi:hypothetical protein
VIVKGPRPEFHRASAMILHDRHEHEEFYRNA